jgi:hypothetical protein
MNDVLPTDQRVRKEIDHSKKVFVRRIDFVYYEKLINLYCRPSESLHNFIHPENQRSI